MNISSIRNTGCVFIISDIVVKGAGSIGLAWMETLIIKTNSVQRIYFAKECIDQELKMKEICNC